MRISDLVPVSQVADIVLGGTPKRSKDAYWGGDIKWASAKDITSVKTRYIYNTEETITALGLEESNTKLLPKDTIVITARGTVGAMAMLSEPMTFNQTCYGLLAKEGVDSTHLFYALKADLSKIKSVSYGTVFDTITMKSFDAITIPLPPLEEQKRIAHILGTLDDKIELNQRMNATLEEIARAVFKSWFVDFDPVRAKMAGEPYSLPDEVMALFPDELVDSELGLIPKGWEVEKVGDIAINSRDVVHPVEVDKGTFYIGLEHMPKRCIALDTWENADKVTSNKYAFRKGSILFGKLRPYFHKVGISPVDGICSTDILIINGKENIYQNFLLYLLSSKVFVENVSAASTGTKMPRTSWKYIESFEIPIPSQLILEKFDTIVKPMVDKIVGNIHLYQNLARLRDVLLLKLMNGEVEV